MRRNILLIAFALVVFLIATGGAFLQEVPPDLTDLQGVLVWLATVGSPYFIGWVLSLVVENWAGWAALPRPLKIFIPMVASVLVSLGANLLLQYPTLIEQGAPWFSIVMGSVLGWLGTQQAYMSVNKAEYGARFR